MKDNLKTRWILSIHPILSLKYLLDETKMFKHHDLTAGTSLQLCVTAAITVL